MSEVPLPDDWYEELQEANDRVEIESKELQIRLVKAIADDLRPRKISLDWVLIFLGFVFCLGYALGVIFG